MIRFIAFDAEFAIQEILELSIFTHEADDATSPESFPDVVPEETFHQYFKPRTERFWPFSQKVHHISPKLVAHRPFITRFQDEIERQMKGADYLIGFDIHNDINALENEGVSVGDTERIIDVKDLHWLVYGRENGVPLDGRKGLEVTAGELGMEFEDNKAHGASYDTLITMKCFLHLIGVYSKNHPEAGIKELLQLYREEWEFASDEYHREFAKGYLSLIPAAGGYRLKVSRNPARNAELSIPVNARKRALNEVDAKFFKRLSKTDHSVYCLKPADIEWLKGYSNEYDSQEQIHQKMYELRHKAI